MKLDYGFLIAHSNIGFRNFIKYTLFRINTCISDFEDKHEIIKPDPAKYVLAKSLYKLYEEFELKLTSDELIVLNDLKYHDREKNYDEKDYVLKQKIIYQKWETVFFKKHTIYDDINKAVLGFRGKTKAELQSQARELEYFNQWKGTETKEVRDKTNLAKYQTFVTNNPEFSDYSYQEWRDLVEVFGSTENFIDSFGYENLKELHKESVNNGKKINLAGAMRDIMKSSKGAQFTQEDVIDLLRSEIFK